MFPTFPTSLFFSWEIGRNGEKFSFVSYISYELYTELSHPFTISKHLYILLPQTPVLRHDDVLFKTIEAKTLTFNHERTNVHCLSCPLFVKTKNNG